MDTTNNLIDTKEAISLLVEEKTKCKRALDAALDLCKVADEKKVREKLKLIWAYDLAASALRELDAKQNAKIDWASIEKDTLIEVGCSGTRYKRYFAYYSPDDQLVYYYLYGNTSKTTIYAPACVDEADARLYTETE